MKIYLSNLIYEFQDGRSKSFNKSLTLEKFWFHLLKAKQNHFIEVKLQECLISITIENQIQYSVLWDGEYQKAVSLLLRFTQDWNILCN